ncbi:DUF305 domain-containing protein [Coleofasciculus sp. H7-2]|uniref:DUF305 domain-containing protein n=1 Tax=Coleofasciculus sp. H7-2 TaxID=3351545 RepID=UPI00366F42BF
MQPNFLKNGFFAVTLVAIASMTGGFLTACSSGSQNQAQAPNASPSDAGGMENMGHGSGMNHSMAMDLGAADANYDLRFIDAMTVHHQGAVMMAKEAQQKSKRPEIKQLADNIIKDQNKEINQMTQWRRAWYPQASKQPVAYGGADKSVVPMSEQQRQSMMMSGDMGAADAEFDLRFINGMIAHHEGALTMAQDALSKSKRSEIKQLSQQIITSQKAEIEKMNQWRQAWYKK